MTEPVLQARGLEVTFRGRGNRSARAVDGVDLSLGHGEIVALVGRAGAARRRCRALCWGWRNPPAARCWCPAVSWSTRVRR